MAVQVLTLAQIETAVLQAMGYTASTYAPWLTSANFYLRVNEYLQRLPQRASTIAKELGIAGPNEVIRFEMWKTACASAGNSVVDVQVSAGSSLGYMPANYDQMISLYDVTNKNPIYVVTNVDDRYIDRLRNKCPGPPEAIEIMGFASEAGRWRQYFTIYPSTVAGVTPVFTMKYYRMPTAMTLGTEFPDIDPKFESLVIYGTICDLSRSIGLEFPRYDALEKDMIKEMIIAARAF
jgi:hypothetical protein